MLQVIIQLLPTIFLSCATLIVLLNIRPLLAYVLYIVSMAFQPKQLVRTTIQVEKSKYHPKKQNVSLLIPFIRLKTLVKVLFFPDVDISRTLHKNKIRGEATPTTLYDEKTRESVEHFEIRSYSASGLKNTTHFRNAIDPVSTPNVSQELETNFPTLKQNIQKIFSNK